MNIDNAYQELLQDILENGVMKSDRTGTGTISVFGRQIRHNMQMGFPLLTIKKMPWQIIKTELSWFLQGNTNIQFLVQNGCNIWNGDAYKHYKTLVQNPVDVEVYIDRIKTDDVFAKLYGELGPIYGKQWRDFGGVDQIKKLMVDLYENPDSRRLMVSAWNPGELSDMVLPPCHYGFQIYTRILPEYERRGLFIKKYPEKDHNHDHIIQEMDSLNIPTRGISLMWNQRSVDTLLGLPFNIASYGLLLEMIGSEMNMMPDELIGNLGDTHIYLDQIGENLTELISRNEYTLPTIKIQDGIYSNHKGDDIKLENYKSHGTLKFPLSN